MTDLLRAGAMFLFLWLGYGLVMLTVLTLADSLANASLKAVLSFRQNPEMVIHPGSSAGNRSASCSASASRAS